MIDLSSLLEAQGSKGSSSTQLYAKVESRNPGGSVKDRMAYSIIKGAMDRGELHRGDTVIESTSGNTGIALAMISAALGLHFVATMPESMSVERRHLLRGFGAELVLTPADKGMSGANAKAEEIAKERGYFWTRQFENLDNPKAHRLGTGPEITRAVPNLGAFVAGVGTGGTITGVGEHLGEIGSPAELIALEPADSPVLSGGSPGPHKIQGIGAGFIPTILKTELLKEIITITNEEAFAMAVRIRKEFGINAGISSGSNVAGALKVATRDSMKGLAVVTVICDTGDRYYSTPIFPEVVVE